MFDARFEFEASTFVARPPAEVFAFLADCENDLRWRSGVVSIRRVAGGAGEVGARYAQRVNPMGREIDADFEITAVEPGRRLAFATLTRNAVRPQGEYRFTAEGGGTRVSLHMTIHTEGLAARAAQPMMRAGMSRSFAADFARLKALLEGAPAA